MATQTELVEFFEMMARRARQGEFRFFVIGTMSYANEATTSMAGMATDQEVTYLTAQLNGQLANAMLEPQDGSAGRAH